MILATIVFSLASAPVMFFWLKAISARYEWSETAYRLEDEYVNFSKAYFTRLQQRHAQLDTLDSARRELFVKNLTLYAEFAAITMAVVQRLTKSSTHLSLCAPMILHYVFAFCAVLALFFSELAAVPFVAASVISALVSLVISLKVIVSLTREPVEMGPELFKGSAERDLLGGYMTARTLAPDVLVRSTYLNNAGIGHGLAEIAVTSASYCESGKGMH